MNNQILSEEKIEKILKRLAFQIIENNFLESEIVLVGISGQGMQMARNLKEFMYSIRPEIKSTVCELFIDKHQPVRSDIKMDTDLKKLEDSVIVLVDDVLNTGRTTAYALSYLLQLSLKKLETAVLVNRQYTRFPVAATYSGISLSTTLDDHIEVKLDKEVGAYLY
ncbi:MAG: phosphoribosyltransferase family protein [Crocinitomicaceae bacterium]